MKKKSIKAEEFDAAFDRGDSVLEFLDVEKIARPGQEQRRVNVDIPVWMIRELDKEASRIGVTRQSIIKMWLAERLKETA